MCGEEFYIYTVCGHGFKEVTHCDIKKYHARKDWLKWVTTLFCSIPDCPKPHCDGDAQFIYGFCPSCCSCYLEGEGDMGQNLRLYRPQPEGLRSSVAFLNYWDCRRKEGLRDRSLYTNSPGVHPAIVFRKDKPVRVPDVDAEVRIMDSLVPWTTKDVVLQGERLQYLCILRMLTLRWADELAGKNVDMLYPLTSTERIVMEDGPLLHGSRQPRKFSDLPGYLHGLVVDEQPPMPESPMRLHAAVSRSRKTAVTVSPTGPPTLEDWQARIKRYEEEVLTPTTVTTTTTTTERSTSSPYRWSSIGRTGGVAATASPQENGIHAPRPRSDPIAFRGILDIRSPPLPSPSTFVISGSPVSEFSDSPTSPTTYRMSARDDDVYELEDVAL
ncbi:hypothetical protein QBC34DRAFT_376410 [Podospora aff. communis PSN243]|uniref:Uncharacterized protein n=1 Tax=Podospora aff. communis PSN243 TaxID=3040156 RepID=A0AAV9H0K4_9PEZI|nr:hypothetical protein QBC34DRAFT_376410 [Podospora aff. communis PSN243]